MNCTLLHYFYIFLGPYNKFFQVMYSSMVSYQANNVVYGAKEKKIIINYLNGKKTSAQRKLFEGILQDIRFQANNVVQKKIK